MLMDIKVETCRGTTAGVRIDRFPDHCPLCHYGIEARYQKLSCVTEGFDGRLELVFQCPREKCQSFFIARYLSTYRGAMSHYYTYRGSFPFEPFDIEFAESIEKISPDYCAIANQAQKAEQQGWTLVAGPGYRKALEFLVKDYLCRVRPTETEKIKTMQLGACIAAYVTNDRIKSTAARAAWLGNDETHYVRKWEDKDLDDLKKLISLTVHWIEMEEMTDSVVKEMPEGKK